MSQAKGSDEFTLYHYEPNRGAAILFVVLFLLGTIIYGFQVGIMVQKASVRQKRGVFKICNRIDTDIEAKSKVESVDPEQRLPGSMQDRKPTVSSIACCFIPFFIGCIMEAVGYIARAISSSDKEALHPFVVQSVLLLIAPALYAGSIYMLFGRLLSALGCGKLMLVSSKFGTTTFVIGDVLSFLLQSSGGGLMVKEDDQNTGKTLVVAGLAVQIIFFGFFIFNELRFTIKLHKVCPFYWTISRKWFFFNMALQVSSALIMMRSIVRLIEFVEGFDGYTISHELFIYVFDALPMFLVSVAFCIGSYYGDIFEVIFECNKARHRQ